MSRRPWLLPVLRVLACLVCCKQRGISLAAEARQDNAYAYDGNWLVDATEHRARISEAGWTEPAARRSGMASAATVASSTATATQLDPTRGRSERPRTRELLQAAFGNNSTDAPSSASHLVGSSKALTAAAAAAAPTDAPDEELAPFGGCGTQDVACLQVGKLQSLCSQCIVGSPT